MRGASFSKCTLYAFPFILYVKLASGSTTNGQRNRQMMCAQFYLDLYAVSMLFVFRFFFSFFRLFFCEKEWEYFFVVVIIDIKLAFCAKFDIGMIFMCL